MYSPTGPSCATLSAVKVSVITPSFNSARFITQTVQSVLAQRGNGLELEYLVLDGGSMDGTLDALKPFRHELDFFRSAPDRGPADAINEGLSRATGELVAWLNADDLYHPDALSRVVRAAKEHPRSALFFGRCCIVDEAGMEIRRPITRFKDAFHPFSCRPLIQSINYISQPAMFFRRTAQQAAGTLRLDLKAAWDYDWVLRLWRHGGAHRVPGAPLADFRWHPGSISGHHYAQQFREELEIARADAGRWSPQAFAHTCVRWGIVTIYRAMARRRVSEEM